MATIYYENDADLSLLEGKTVGGCRVREPGPRPRPQPE